MTTDLSLIYAQSNLGQTVLVYNHLDKGNLYLEQESVLPLTRAFPGTKSLNKKIVGVNADASFFVAGKATKIA